MVVKCLQVIFQLSLISFGVLSYSLPLSTRGKLIIDSASGQSVKLVCVCWAAHMQTMLAEGLDKRPLPDIVAKVVEQKFNCVRFTWATYMFTRFNESTVLQTLDSLRLSHVKEGIGINNPFMLHMTLTEAFEAVVDELGKQGLLVVLDNHVSNPQWCCGDNDGNGFFGDADFDPNEWERGLATVAELFMNKNQVVGMSLRNELRGPRQNPPDWYKHISSAAELVHAINPYVLVLVSGINYALDLSFLKNQPLGVNLDNKLVYEAHWYSWSVNSGSWTSQPWDQACVEAEKVLNDKFGFVTDGDNPTPLFLGEFGIDQRGTNEGDNNYFHCFMNYASTRNFSWSLWSLQGNYYLREGQPGVEEVYGMLNADWSTIRNLEFIQKLQALQLPVLASKLRTSSIMFHPNSSSCVSYSTKSRGIYADSSCLSPIQWIHERDGAPLRLMGTRLYLKVVGDRLAPVVSPDCSSQQSLWYSVSASKLQLAAKDQNGQYLCLGKISSNSTRILTKKCICINDDPGCLDDSQGQWFTLASKNLQ